MIRKISTQNSKIFKQQYDRLTAEGYVVVKVEGPTYIFEKNDVPNEPIAPKSSSKVRLRKRTNSSLKGV